MPPRRSSYIRKGIERDLLRREQGLRYLRQHFTENMAECVDESKLSKARKSAILAMEMHISLCHRMLEDMRAYLPRYFNVRLQAFRPLTPDVLESRRQARLIKARAHAAETAKNKSRRAKRN